MCVVSYIGDYFKQNIPNTHQWVTTYPIQYPSKEEFEALKKEVEELKKLLIAAKIYDENTNQPHCEQEEKVEFIKKIAEFVGVDLNDVLK